MEPGFSEKNLYVLLYHVEMSVYFFPKFEIPTNSQLALFPFSLQAPA